MSCDMNESNWNVIKFYMNINIAHIIRIARIHAVIVVQPLLPSMPSSISRGIITRNRNLPRSRPSAQSSVTRHTHNAEKSQIPKSHMTHHAMCITSPLQGHHVAALAHRSCSLAREHVTSHLLNLREKEISRGRDK